MIDAIVQEYRRGGELDDGGWHDRENGLVPIVVRNGEHGMSQTDDLPHWIRKKILAGGLPKENCRVTWTRVGQ